MKPKQKLKVNKQKVPGTRNSSFITITLGKMKSLVGIHAIATSLLLTAIPCASEVTPPWTFQVMADWHGAEWYATHPVPGDDEVLYNLQKDGLLNIREEFGGDLIVMPGDTNSGNWNIQSWVDNNFPGHSIQDAVYKAGINCYSTVRNLFTEAGYEKILISIGDHELGKCFLNDRT